MIEGTYRIDFYYDGANTGYVTGHYSTPDTRYGLETLTVDEYSIGDIDEFIVTSDTIFYTRYGDNPSLGQWLVAIASVKTDIVFKATKINFGDFYFNDHLLLHVDDNIIVRLSADEITCKRNNRVYVGAHDNYKDVIIIFDCEKFFSKSYEPIMYELRIIFTDRLQYIKCTGGLFGSVGIYNLSNLKYIGGGTFLRSSFFIVDKDTLPNETVYNFEPTIVEGEYEGIQVLKKWALIKFADDCVIETAGVSAGVEDHIMFDLCNISNGSGKEAFSIGGSEVLIKIKNTLRTDFFCDFGHVIYAYCEDEEFLRNMRDGYGTPLSDWLIRPKYFVVQAVRPNNWYDNLMYNLKYTPNINTGVTLCCDVNCLEYGVGHYTAEMTDDLNIGHKTLCVGYEKTNKYYRIKED